MAWYVGVDVSKDALDACGISEEGKREARFDNNAQGIARLLAWAKALGKVAALGMEATGGYEFDLAGEALEAKLPTSVENPRRVKDFARAMGYLNKTDRADARAIAEFLRRIGPSPWRLADPHVRELAELTRHRSFLQGERNRIQNRLGHRKRLPELVVSQLEARLKTLDQEVDELDKARLGLVQKQEALHRDLEALVGIPGVGQTTALLVLAEAGDVENFPDAQSYASQSGLAPCRRESGKSQGRSQISKAGSRHLRGGLFLAGSVAARYHPEVMELRARLLAKGKTKMQALIACMRKLLMICYGVLKKVRNGEKPYYGKRPAKPNALTN